MQIQFKTVETTDTNLANIWFGSLPDPDSMLKEFQILTKVELLEVFNQEMLGGWTFSHYWLIDVNSNTVGYLLVTSSDKPYGNCNGSAIIQEIYVLSDYRNQRIEKQSLNLVEDFCDERKLHLSFLNKPEWKLFEN